MYTPEQLMWLNYAQRADPQMVPQLVAQFRAANRPQFNSAAGDAETATARQRYQAETLNPQLGSVAVKDGPNPSSVASARQADLVAAGNRGAEEVSQIGKNGAYDRALNLYQLQMQQQNDDNDGYGGYYGKAAQGGSVEQDGLPWGQVAGGVMELGKRYFGCEAPRHVQSQTDR